MKKDAEFQLQQINLKLIKYKECVVWHGGGQWTIGGRHGRCRKWIVREENIGQGHAGQRQ